jgi:hypothetical protein
MAGLLARKEEDDALRGPSLERKRLGNEKTAYLGLKEDEIL